MTDEFLGSLYERETVECVLEILGLEDHDELTAVRMPEFERHWQEMARLRRPASGDRLLDFGCQTGEFGSIAQRDGVTPFGVELAEGYAQLAEQRWGCPGAVHSGSLDGAPFHDGTFAYVTAFETLEHMCDPVTVLRKLGALLQPDGLLAISVPSSDYFHLKYWLLKRSPFAGIANRALGVADSSRAVLPHTHIYNFSERSVSMMLGKVGFRPIISMPTGWHGQRAGIANTGARLLAVVTGRRLALAPSVFTVARTTASIT